MKRGLLFIALLGVLISCIGVNAINVTSCSTPLNESGTYDLVNSVSATLTCFTVTASDVVLDCHGYTVTYDTGGAANARGVYAVGGSNLTVKNCNFVDTTTAAHTSSAVFFNNWENATVYNNTMDVDGTYCSRAGYLLRSNRINFSNNVGVMSGTNGACIQGVYVIHGSSYNTISNNHFTITTPGNGGSAGIDLYNQTSHNRIENNTISITSFSGGADSIFGITIIVDVYNNTVRNNDVTVLGNPVTFSPGIRVISGGADNVVEGNRVNVSTSTNPSNGWGIHLASMDDSRIENNNITNIGTSGNHGLYLQSNTNALVRGNSVNIGLSSTAAAIRSHAATNDTLIGNTISNAAILFSVTGDSQGTLVNTTLDYPTDVTINGPIAFSTTGQNISGSDFVINSTSVFVNVTANPLLNTTSTLTFSNTGFIGHRALVDYNDDGNFVICPSTLCTEITDVLDTFVVQVAHFTTFSISEFVEPVPEFHEWALMILLTVALAGVVVMRRQ